MNAAAKARELIDKYQLEIGAEAVISEGMDKYEFLPNNGAYEQAFYDFVINDLEQLCEIQTWSHMSWKVVGTVSVSELNKKQRGAGCGRSEIRY